ncbi:Major Facilitator Superfamily protein [Planctomycetes bacterium Pan216]|uniref:Major Facilitator Superfamily protein n=1 Tax=Kolteria novifilia TaxID=2527975 RepID=A0A518AZV1_9BACT|nr:Major Facilitator Superfamily protein [Planctomycetes bacterium Pan216]
MIQRFCLYGFLKNQRYFEPFWIIAFLDKGLSFASIGLLIGFREISIALLEIPTGAIADVVGRRWAMIFSHVAYVVAFLVFGFSSSIVAIFVAMLAFAIGEAFRTGTHKAIIFAWLKSQGREREKTAVYGITRSWSQAGSAVSVIIAAVMVFVSREYSAIFWMSAIPTSLNIVNFLTYPSWLDGVTAEKKSNVVRLLLEGLRQCFFQKSLRRLLFESMGYEGMFKAGKDYLQPMLQQLVLAAPLLMFLDPIRRTAVAIAVVYTAFYLMGSYAARMSGTASERFGGEERAAGNLWVAFGIAFLILLAGNLTDTLALVMASALGLAGLQNVWRPILISRVAKQAEEHSMATVLSIESQAKSLGVAGFALLLGVCVDWMPEAYRFAPVGLMGILVALLALVSSPTGTRMLSTRSPIQAVQQRGENRSKPLH